jgi:hypothetical protein
MLTHTLALFAVLGLWTAQAALAGYAASRKGRSFNAWTIAGLIVGPAAIVLALLVPQRRLFG